MRRSLLICLALAAAGCNAEKPTAVPFGSELSTADQVAVEAAFLKVVDTLNTSRKTADDSLIAQFTQIAARLVRLEGRYGTIDVLLPGSATRVPMRAIVATGSDVTLSPDVVSFVLAWSDLDVGTFTVKRALLVQSGGFSGTVAPQVRYLDMTGGATAGLCVGGGTLTLTGKSFPSGCEGLGSTAGATCKAGKGTVSATASIARGTGTPTSMDFPVSTIAAFEVIVK